MQSSEEEVQANEMRTARDTDQLLLMEPNQHLQDGVREEDVEINDGIEVEWPLYEDATPPSDVGDKKSQVKPQSPVRLRRSTRDRKITYRALEHIEQEDLQFNIAYSVQYYEAMHESDYQMQELLQYSIAFKASSDPDT
eukprot:5758842-Ditylum_brightwellii.AAC.1